MNRKTFARIIVGIVAVIVPACLLLSYARTKSGKNTLSMYTINRLSGLDHPDLFINDFNDQGDIVGEFTLPDATKIGSRAYMWKMGKSTDLGSIDLSLKEWTQKA